MAYASARKQTGLVYVNGPASGCWKTGRYYKILTPNPWSGPVKYSFLSHNGKIYYVNGRMQVYETDILDFRGVLFTPVCRQTYNGRWCEVNFRLMDKLEWIFLM
jgi:hypothetical protein